MSRTTLARRLAVPGPSRGTAVMKVAVIRINAQPDDLPVTTYKRAAYEAIRDMIVEL